MFTNALKRTDRLTDDALAAARAGTTKGSCRRGRRRPVGQVAAFEALEPRLLLDGDVTVACNGGKLELTGDAGSNAVAVSARGLADGWVSVSGIDGTTTVNGQPTWLIRVGELKDVKAEFNGGADTFILDALELSGNVKLDGNDTRPGQLALIDTFVEGGVKLKGGDADHTLALLGHTVVGGKVNAKAKGRFRLAMDIATVAGGVNMKAERAEVRTERMSTIEGGMKIKAGDAGVDAELADTILRGGLSAKAGDGLLRLAAADTGITDGLKLKNKGAAVDIDVDDSEIAGGVNLKNGGGLVDVGIRSALMRGEIKAKLGDGGSRWDVYETLIDGDVNLRCGDGGDNIGLVDVALRELKLQTNGGTDTLECNDFTGFAGWDVDMGDGSDRLWWDAGSDPFGGDTILEGPVKIDLGTGVDRLTIGSAAACDSVWFRDGCEVDGGDDYDIADYMGHGNTGIPAGAVSNFEWIAM